MQLLPNRVALYLTAAAGLLGGLAPVIANLDFASTAGIAAGLGAVSLVVFKWMDGWSKWERGVVPAGTAELVEPEPPDLFDEETAEPIPTSSVKAAQVPEGTTLKQPEPPPPSRKAP